MRTRKVPYVSDIHCLLGSTLRDSGSQREGTVVGINQYSNTPCIEVRWNDKQAIERVEITWDQLDQLIKLSREKLAAEPQKAVRRDVQNPASDSVDGASLEDTRRRA